jgi:cation/acetate symporter
MSAAALPLAIGTGVNGLALAVFAIVLSVTLAITFWASKRTSTATEFWAAGRGISGLQNGFAMAGDYLSASTFLGFAGLIFLFGVDGWVGLAAAGASFLPVVLLLAERMRNSGKFTMADVLAFRLRERPARMAAALGTLSVSFVYLLAQMVGAGVLLRALAGISFSLSVVLTGTFMLVYVVFGGMLATTWVQIIKAGLLMIAGTVLTILVLANGISFGLALLLGTAGLPHLLMRFFTVPDARAARRSIGWAVALIGAFFIMTLLVGVGARAILGAGAVEASAGGNLATPMLAERLGGGQGTVGGDLFLAIISAIAFATILAVVAGLVIAASGAVAHDVWTGVVRQGRADEHEEVRVARTASIGLGVLAIIVSILAGPNFNVSVLVGLAFAVAASCNLPALLLALFWPRFNTTGAVAGVLGGLIVAVVIIGLSPPVWPGADGQGSPVSLRNPAIISIPAGFLCCWLGTMLSREGATARSYHELHVRAETGIGAF